MVISMRTKCICGKVFKAKIKRIMLDEDIQDIYFECPRCIKKYHIAFTDSEIREHNKKMQLLKEKLLDDRGNIKLFEEVQELMRQHKQMMDDLNNTDGRCSAWQ